MSRGALGPGSRQSISSNHVMLNCFYRHEVFNSIGQEMTRPSSMDEEALIKKTGALPDHINETVRAIARLRAEHREEATAFQRLIEKVTASAGSPRFVAVLSLVTVGWVAFNLVLGPHAWDAPPFAWLQGITGLGALYMAILILSTQRRDNLLASYREQLMLELVILGEQKTAKIIGLIEELRWDDPNIRNRSDQEATNLSVPAEPHAVFNAIKATHDDELSVNKLK
jgi:uncharacterized membrane protein